MRELTKKERTALQQGVAQVKQQKKNPPVRKRRRMYWTNWKKGILAILTDIEGMEKEQISQALYEILGQK